VFLIDTNVISEVRKGERCDRHVAAWYASIEDSTLFLSALVLGEIRRGVELARRTDAQKADALARWLKRVEASFGQRVLSVDVAVADEWGRMSATRPIPVIDGLLAATAKIHGLTLATRDDETVRGLGARVVNPFRPGS
jgi:predicted nucleic acid-binding protein